jgi:1,4-alpha-glucan branching enzyme
LSIVVAARVSGKEEQTMAKAKKATPATKAAPVAKAKKAPAAKAVSKAGLSKKYLKTRPACKVTFFLPKEAAPEAETVAILGEFNNWAPEANPLTRLDEGDFTITLELETGRSYRFRYVIDGWRYENDWFADRYEPNPFGGEDSIVDV